jgi:chemotaxis protein CheX
MKAEFVNPFVIATYEILKRNGITSRKGTLSALESALESDEVTVVIGVVGRAHGVILYAMSEHTAKNLVGAITQKSRPLFDKEEEAVLGGLSADVTQLASSELESLGYPCTITPPSIVVGKGTSISVANIKRLVLPIETEHGEIVVHIALQQRAE